MKHSEASLTRTSSDIFSQHDHKYIVYIIIYNYVILFYFIRLIYFIMFPFYSQTIYRTHSQNVSTDVDNFRGLVHTFQPSNIFIPY